MSNNTDKIILKALQMKETGASINDIYAIFPDYKSQLQDIFDTEQFFNAKIGSVHPSTECFNSLYKEFRKETVVRQTFIKNFISFVSKKYKKILQYNFFYLYKFGKIFSNKVFTKNILILSFSIFFIGGMFLVNDFNKKKSMNLLVSKLKKVEIMNNDLTQILQKPKLILNNSPAIRKDIDSLILAIDSLAKDTKIKKEM